jgi:hypothetical protein
VTVDSDINDLITGNIYSFSSITDCSAVSASNLDREPIGPIGPIRPIQECFPFGCYVVDRINLSDSDQPDAVIVNSYGSNCTDCTNDIANYLVFGNCFFEGNELYVPIEQITPTPVVGDFYYLEYLIGGRGEVYNSFGCFRFRNRIYLQPGDRIEQEVVILNETIQPDCQTCLDSSPIVYEGYDCVGETQFFVALPSEGLENHLITYTDLDGLTQYCGLIKSVVRDQTPTVLLVSILGLFNDETNNCEDCLLLSNEKKELINCLEPTTEVVWASVLFTPGISTHISGGDGCYEIGDTVDPSTPITIPELANYEPHDNCEDCLECHGLIYEYTSCEELEVCRVTNSINFSNLSNLYSGRDFVIDSNNYMFVPFRDSNAIGKYDLTTQTLVQISSSVLSGAESVAIDEGNGVVCVSNYNSNYVTFFDYNDLTLFVNRTTLSNPKKVYYEPVDGYFYVTINSCCGGPGIFVYTGSSYSSMTQAANFGNNNAYKDIVRIGSDIYTITQSATLEIWSIVGLTYTQINTINLGVGVDSLTYDSVSNVIYIKTFTNYYLKFFVGSATLSIINYSAPCGFGEGKITVNNSTNKIYITDSSCNIIYEFDKITDTLIRTYNNLSNDGVSQVYGIGIDTSSNTWFSAYNNLFQLTCSLEFINGSVTSNEYLPTGTTFFNYSLSACCEITSIESITDENFLGTTEYLSMLHFEDCVTCLGSDVQIFVCRDCSDFGEGLLISSGGTHNVGDFVRSQYGNSDFVCLEIIDVYTSNYGNGYLSFVSDGNSYTSCEECSSGSSIGLTIINCDTLVPSHVNVSLSEWSEIAGYPFSIPSSVVSDSNGTCYQVANACPIDNNNPEFRVSNYYYNQSFCRASNQRTEPPRSAGTEYFECVICCDCGSTGSTVTQVSPPHPVWTDGYGTPVTQLNMVALGGMFGLNN